MNVSEARKHFEHALVICSPDKCPEEALVAYERLMHSELVTTGNGSVDRAVEFAYRAAFAAETTGHHLKDFHSKLAKCLRRIPNDIPHTNRAREAQRCSDESNKKE